MTLPFKNIIHLNRGLHTPIYLQLVEQLMALIQTGKLAAGAALPGSRALAKLLGLHRNTVSTAYEELEAQGWVTIVPKRGVFVQTNLPIITLKYQDQASPTANHLGYTLRQQQWAYPKYQKSLKYQLDDGIPDVRLAPLAELGTAYRRLLKRGNTKQWLGYGSVFGTAHLRQALKTHLQQSRGLTLDTDHIMTTRGSIMGLYLSIQALVEVGDAVVVGLPNYGTVNQMFEQAGAQLHYLKVDEDGLDVAALAVLCEQVAIKVLYVAPHHHHPTTVTLSMSRRLQLLQLARNYGFAILEDDYDYDFHYQRNPILPLASLDGFRQVIYIGSLSKVLAPAFRVGFVVAHPDFIQRLGGLRRMVDRQGDVPLERAIADLFEEGLIQRHLRKSLKQYQLRRDQLASLLENKLGTVLSFDLPKGGMAIWAQFSASTNWAATVSNAAQQGLALPAPRAYTSQLPQLQASRLGFASSSVEELEAAVAILAKAWQLNG